ncbi:hypothetical protein LTR67_011297 [Exophiala xenobiotica]
MISRTALPQLKLSLKTLQLLKQETEYSAGGFEPVPAFFAKAEGVRLWDVDGKEYLDFIAMFSAVNTGHRHPYILQKVVEQLQTATLFNLATHNTLWPPFAEMICRRFGYDKVIAMTSGTEAADTACKIARKWGLQVKGIAPNDCVVFGVGQSYHGLGSGVWPLMDPSPRRKAYGLDCNQSVMNVNPSSGSSLGYLDLEAMRRCLQEHHSRTAGVIMECFHGSARTVEEEWAYARGVYDLCKAHNILFIADEVRAGAGKTGKFCSYQHLGDDCKPDIVTMGKSVTGGFYPQSFILGTKAVMALVGSNQTASTYAMAPLAIAAAQATIEVIDREHLMDRAVELGDRWKAVVASWNHPKVNYVACVGADSNLFLKGTPGPRLAAMCLHKGVLTYPRPDGLRLSFPMTMTTEELEHGAALIREALDEVDQYDTIPGEHYPF